MASTVNKPDYSSVILVAGSTSYSLGAVITYDYPSITSLSPNTLNALSNVPLTLNGARFGWNKSFYTYFEAQSNWAIGGGVNFISISDTQIVLTSRAGWGNNINVFLAWGTSSYVQLPAGLSYNNLPTITSVTGSPISYAFGSSITVTGTNFPPTGSCNLVNIFAISSPAYATINANAIGASDCTPTSFVVNFPPRSTLTINDASHCFNLYLKWGPNNIYYVQDSTPVIYYS